MADSSVLSSAVTSASYNMVLQFVFRLLTFFLNGFVLRYISRDMLGVVNVRLTLLYLTVQLLSREAFRRACLSKASQDRVWYQTINLVWLVVPAGLVWSGLCGAVWAYLLEMPSESAAPYYRLAVLAFAASSLLEMLSEPLYVVAQILLFVRLKVVVEGVALLVRCLATVLLVVWAPHWGLLAFCLPQLLYTATISAMYYGYFAWYLATHKADRAFPFLAMRDFFPKRPQNMALLSYEQALLTWSFFKQSFLKQILTDGEKYVMTFFGLLSFGDQGIFDVITNLGSLAARFVFLPIEESSYLYFTQSLQRGLKAGDQDKEAQTLATSVLRSLLKAVLLMGAVIVVFGWPYSFLLLDIYGGQLLSGGGGPALLRAFCGYVLLLAVNGVSECFAFATMSRQQVDRYNYKLLLFSIVFLCASWFFTRQLGSIGFIFANCLNMAVRIAHSLYHVHRYYAGTEERPLRALLLSPQVLAALALSLVITLISESRNCCEHGVLFRIVHVWTGGICLSAVLGVVAVFEKDLMAFISAQYLERQAKLKEN